MNQTLLKFLKIGVSIALMSVLLWNVDWVEVRSGLAATEVYALLVAFSILVLQFPLSTWKWSQSLQIHKLYYSFGFLQTVLCIGFFFNNFLPTGIGGDAYRILRTMPAEGMKSGAISAVLLERIVGVLALLALGYAGSLWLLAVSNTPLVQAFAALGTAGAAAGALGLALVFTPRLAGVRARLSGIAKLQPLVVNLQYIRLGGRNLLSLILLSIVFQVLAVGATYLLFRSLGVDLGFGACAVVAALSGLAVILPISIAGIGVYEGTFAIVAAELGANFDDAVITAIILRVLTIPLSATCGLIYLFTTAREPQVARADLPRKPSA